MNANKTHCHGCELALPNPSGGVTGYRLDEFGNAFCYACCAKIDKERMVRDGKSDFLYLSMDGAGEWVITNWPGSLRFKAIRVSLSDHNMAGKNGRRDTWFVGPDGKVWHGVSVGNSDVLHAKRTKG